MKPSAAIALAALLLAVGFLLSKGTRKPAQWQLESTGELVARLANEAVKDAREQNRLGLDYSVAPIEKVEKVPGGAHHQAER